MPSLNLRLVLLTAGALTCITFGVIPYAAATPLPAAADSRIRRIQDGANASHARVKHFMRAAYHVTEHSPPQTVRKLESRVFRRDSLGDPISAISPSCGEIISVSKLLSAQAAVANTNGNNAGVQQQNADYLSQFNQGLTNFHGILLQLASDKGLANYNKQDELETLLKNVVNAIKNALTAIDVLVYRNPLLGPILGPLVYDLKCLVDELLDATQNLTDGLLELLAPLLRNLDNQVVNLLCGPLASVPSLNLVGICNV